MRRWFGTTLSWSRLTIEVTCDNKSRDGRELTPRILHACGLKLRALKGDRRMVPPLFREPSPRLSLSSGSEPPRYLSGRPASCLTPRGRQLTFPSDVCWSSARWVSCCTWVVVAGGVVGGGRCFFRCADLVVVHAQSPREDRCVFTEGKVLSF